MLVAFGLICLLLNLAAICFTVFLRDWPAPGGRLANIAIHTIGAACGWFLVF